MLARMILGHLTIAVKLDSMQRKHNNFRRSADDARLVLSSMPAGCDRLLYQRSQKVA
jgi:hypothetical protein